MRGARIWKVLERDQRKKKMREREYFFQNLFSLMRIEPITPWILPRSLTIRPNLVAYTSLCFDSA
jgi:hypothetical protein